MIELLQDGAKVNVQVHNTEAKQFRSNLNRSKSKQSIVFYCNTPQSQLRFLDQICSDAVKSNFIVLVDFYY